MSEFADFYPLIRREAPGVSNPMMDGALLQAAREFCRETYIWQQILDPLSLVEDQEEYELEVPELTRSVAILSMFHDSIPVLPRTSGEMNRIFPGWREDRGNRAQWFLSDIDPHTLRLIPYASEDEDDAITQIKVALQPVNSATELPDIIYDDHSEDLVYGALVRLHRLPRQTNWSWQDAGLSNYYADLFKRAMGRTKIRVIKGFQAGPIYVRSSRLQGAP
jgi:hypothetical protein